MLLINSWPVMLLTNCWTLMSRWRANLIISSWHVTSRINSSLVASLIFNSWPVTSIINNWSITSLAQYTAEEVTSQLAEIDNLQKILCHWNYAMRSIIINKGILNRQYINVFYFGLSYQLIIITPFKNYFLKFTYWFGYKSDALGPIVMQCQGLPWVSH